ncbi:MAG: hypothetical protein ACR2JC_13805 [Chloroflexota bacterium]
MIPQLKLRVRLALWIGGLLVTCTVLLALFINLGTTISTRAGVIVTHCSPVMPVSTTAKILTTCISQSQAPLRPWVSDRTRVVYVLQTCRRLHLRAWGSCWCSARWARGGWLDGP